MITVFTLTYNEEIMLPHFINHYRNNFKNCRIIIFDNESTDSTVEIARKNNCEVITYKTNNKIVDSKYLEIKNNCWKESNTNWNIVCDCDEFCDINENDLKQEEVIGTSIFKFTGYHMINMSEDSNSIFINELNHGIRSSWHDKVLLFDKSKILEMNYLPGCHECKPNGNIKYSDKIYNLYHYKYIGENYFVDRHINYSKRLSEENLKFRWGHHYLQEENTMRKNFKELKKTAKKIK
jgi:glycosyltransferase involved in cell wall biosynthesis